MQHLDELLVEEEGHCRWSAEPPRIDLLDALHSLDDLGTVPVQACLAEQARHPQERDVNGGCTTIAEDGNVPGDMPRRNRWQRSVLRVLQH